MNGVAMQAITYTENGGPEVLHLAEAPKPTPRPTEVLVAVRLAAVNPYDVKLRSGAMAGSMKQTFPTIPGSEIAGVIDSFGSDVTGVSVGDEVFGWSIGGGAAEFARASVFAVKPPKLAWDVAVALPVAGETALRSLALLGLQAGETLLIHGAAGSVGSMAVQLAVQRGVTVIGTCSEKDAESVRELGAHPVRYGDGVFERVRGLATDGVDAVLDTAGRGVLPGSIDLVGGTDRVVTIADPAAAGLGVTFTSGGREFKTPDALLQLAQLAVSGSLTFPPAQHFPLVAAADAHELLARGGQRGKVVLDI